MNTPPLGFSHPGGLDRACRTPSASISFDFEGASASRCAVEGEREFSVLVTPEHAPPINNSPWYAFRYSAEGEAGITVHLRYLGGDHRYAPLLTDGAASRPLPVKVSTDRRSARLELPPGQAIVGAQEIFDRARHHQALVRWSANGEAGLLPLGQSHDRRPIEAVRLGNPSAPRLIVLLGRQHPPEVTGAIAMEAFVDSIAELVAADSSFAKRYQFLVVPLLNPDGVARGHWRANLGGKDINRDWGDFSQPETQAVKRWLDALPTTIRPVLMLDFHSTSRNLFYVQGEEASDRQQQFLEAWLGGRENALPGYPFIIERRNANPGLGTTKNWFHGTYGIPAFTYEVADDADRAATRAAAKELARLLSGALEILDAALVDPR